MTRAMVLGDIWLPPGCSSFVTLAGDEDIELIRKMARRFRSARTRVARWRL